MSDCTSEVKSPHWAVESVPSWPKHPKKQSHNKIRDVQVALAPSVTWELRAEGQLAKKQQWLLASIVWVQPSSLVLDERNFALKEQLTQQQGMYFSAFFDDEFDSIANADALVADEEMGNVDDCSKTQDVFCEY
jgi:hypothetical protein